MKVFVNCDDATIVYSHDSLDRKHWILIPDHIDIVGVNTNGMIYFGCGGLDSRSLMLNRGFRILWERNK